jgi:hypothetical protein
MIERERESTSERDPGLGEERGSGPWVGADVSLFRP